MRVRTKEPLTPRQLEVAQWTACGLSDKEIAMRMHVSTSTITNTKRNINDRYGFNNSCELVAFYFATYHNVPTDFDVVGKIKKAISALALLLIVGLQITFEPNDNIIRARRSSRRSRNEYELTSNDYL